jgi:hypothetical protein
MCVKTTIERRKLKYSKFGIKCKDIFQEGQIRISSRKISIIIGVTYDISINRKNEGRALTGISWRPGVRGRREIDGVVRWWSFLEVPVLFHRASVMVRSGDVTHPP